MNNDRVRLAILGCGGFSASFVQPVLDEVGALDVVACFDPARDAARATAEHFGGRVFTSAAEVHHCSTEVTFRPQKGDTERFECEAGPIIAEEFAEFARAVRGGDPVETDGRTGVMAAAVIDVSVRSAREGRFVDIDEVLRGA